MSEQWRQTQLGKVCGIILGQSPSSDTYNQERIGLPFFQGKSEFGSKYAQAKTWCSDPLRVAKKEDILISVRAPVGESNLAPENCCIGRGLAALRADQENLLQEFLWHQIDFKKGYLQGISQGSTFDAISGRDLSELELELPPLPEQKKIAEILSGIEGVIHRRRSLLEKVTLLASRSFNEVIDKIATEHPIATVESVTTKVIDGPHLTPNYQERGVPFVTVKNISSGKLDLTNTKFITADDHADFCMRGKAEHGDILYSKDGSIGHTCVVPKEYDFSFFVSVALLKTNKELIYPEYLNAVLQSTLIKTQTELMSEGSGLKHMVLRSIKALKIPLPPLDEQIRLMAQLLPVFKSREIIEETIQRMAYFREGIASDLLSGRKRVSV